MPRIIYALCLMTFRVDQCHSHGPGIGGTSIFRGKKSPTSKISPRLVLRTAVSSIVLPTPILAQNILYEFTQILGPVPAREMEGAFSRCHLCGCANDVNRAIESPSNFSGDQELEFQANVLLSGVLCLAPSETFASRLAF